MVLSQKFRFDKKKKSRKLEKKYMRDPLATVVKEIANESFNLNNGQALFSNMPNWLLNFIYMRMNHSNFLTCEFISNPYDLSVRIAREFKRISDRVLLIEIFNYIKKNIQAMTNQVCDSRDSNIIDLQLPEYLSPESVDKACVDVCCKFGLKFDPLSSSGAIDAVTNAMFNNQKLVLVSQHLNDCEMVLN